MKITKFGQRHQHLAIHFVCVCLITMVTGCNRLSNRNSIPASSAPVMTPPIVQKKLPSNKPMPLKAGLIIPLTGQHHKIGLGVEQAAEMALFMKKVPQFDLAIYDTQSTIDGAQDAFNQAVRAGCKIIVGPVFSNEVKAVKSMAQRQNIPLLALSNDTTLSNAVTYVLGLSPVNQIQTMLDYAMESKLQHVITVLPDNELGQTIARKLSQLNPGAEVIFYTPQQLSSLQPLIQRLQSGTIDGLFIPEGGTALARIIASLVYANIDFDQIQLIGSSLWDDPVTIANNSLRGAVMITTDPQRFQKFAQEFKKNYGYQPTKVASIAYDAVTLLMTSKKHFGNDAILKNNLEDPRGYVGSNGVFKLTAQGHVDRHYLVIQINQGLLKHHNRPINGIRVRP